MTSGPKILLPTESKDGDTIGTWKSDFYQKQGIPHSGRSGVELPWTFNWNYAISSWRVCFIHTTSRMGNFMLIYIFLCLMLILLLDVNSLRQTCNTCLINRFLWNTWFKLWRNLFYRGFATERMLTSPWNSYVETQSPMWWCLEAGP